MSLFKEEHLECPFCHQDMPFILHHSINVGIHPEHKAKVLDNTLFRYQCPHCKQTDEVCYPTLYHDPENEIMIQVLWREEDFGQQMDKELQSLIEVMGQKNYRRREKSVLIQTGSNYRAAGFVASDLCGNRSVRTFYESRAPVGATE